MKAREWKKRGDVATDDFEALSNYWRSFNGLYFATLGSDERSKIKLYISNNISELKAEEILTKCEVAVSHLIAKPVVDMRGTGRSTAENVADFSTAENNLRKLVQLVIIIYQIRCNFEHGQKSPKNIRDVELCGFAAEIISEIIADQITLMTTK